MIGSAVPSGSPARKAGVVHQDEHQSLATIGHGFNHDPDWVKAQLRRAGVALRPAGRRRVDHGHVRELLDAGLRVREIAAHLRCSDTTVLSILRENGWSRPPRRPGGTNRIGPPRPSTAVLRRICLTEGLSIGVIAERLGVSSGVIRAALAADGITVTDQDGPGAHHQHRSTRSNSACRTSTSR